MTKEELNIIEKHSDFLVEVVIPDDDINVKVGEVYKASKYQYNPYGQCGLNERVKEVPESVHPAPNVIPYYRNLKITIIATS